MRYGANYTVKTNLAVYRESQVNCRIWQDFARFLAVFGEISRYFSRDFAVFGEISRYFLQIPQNLAKYSQKSRDSPDFRGKLRDSFLQCMHLVLQCLMYQNEFTQNITK